jgi:hypothetical protein
MVSPTPKVGTKVAPRSTWHVLDPDILAWRLEFAPDESFIRDLFELRKIVEPSAAALAALRRSEAALGRLADTLSRLARANPRSGGWLNAIVAFHQELLGAGRNEALASLWPAVQTTLRWSVKLQMMLPTLSLAHDPVADHARVFEKVASQNAEGALTEMALDDTLAPMKRIGAAKAGRGDALSSPATRASGFTHRNSRSSWSAVPDPGSASTAGRKTGVPSDVLWPRPLRGLLPPDQVRGSQALTPPRGSGSWFSWSLLREVGPAGRLRSAKTMDALRRIGAAQSPRSGRSIAEQPRSGLTATGQCGRQPEMCECHSPACGEG